jgi:hypothetical protein
VTAVERPELLIFLHIPKAAGRSFYRVLDRQVPREAIYQTDPVDWRKSIEELQALPEGRLRSFRIVRGHVGFGLQAQDSAKRHIEGLRPRRRDGALRRMPPSPPAQTRLGQRPLSPRERRPGG